MTYYASSQRALPPELRQRRKGILTEIGELSRERLRLQRELAQVEERFATAKAELFALRVDGAADE